MKCPHCDGTGTLTHASFGALLLEARNARGMTQGEVANKAAISRSQIANMEADRTDAPLKTIQRIADALGMSAKDLIP